MLGPASGRHQNGVESCLECGEFGTFGEENFRRANNALTLRGVQRFGRRVEIGAQFYFDEGENAPARGDDIDLCRTQPQIAADDAPARQPQTPRRQSLGPGSALLMAEMARRLHRFLPPSSKARE